MEFQFFLSADLFWVLVFLMIKKKVLNWRTGYFFERLIFDNIQKMIDPKFNDRIIRRINKYRDEQDKEYFWKPGESFPERTPKINIFE